jgi:hypothetical protein
MTGRMDIGEVDGVEAASQHSLCGLRCCAVGFGLRRSKPRRRWAIGGHRLMAAGVGERVEAAEGLYLSCGPRYSRRKMGSG